MKWSGAMKDPFDPRSEQENPTQGKHQPCSAFYPQVGRVNLGEIAHCPRISCPRISNFKTRAAKDGTSTSRRASHASWIETDTAEDARSSPGVCSLPPFRFLQIGSRGDRIVVRTHRLPDPLQASIRSLRTRRRRFFRHWLPMLRRTACSTC